MTTTAWSAFVASVPGFGAALDALDAVAADDADGVRAHGGRLRALLGAAPVPEDIAAAVLAAWRESGEEHSYAVRSSATAEDLPDASFAGQQDTHLNVRGERMLLDRVRDCWASLFTDRAILYRAQHGFDHRAVQLSVVVQRMVLPQVSGILFTADPVRGHRGIVSIDAGFGLGEALVSGLVSADLFRVRKSDGALLEATIADKKLAIVPLPEGGTETRELPPEEGARPSLTEDQARELAALGARVEAHYGRPQDIEWCIEDGTVYLVQSRPITTLFPLPQPPPDDDLLHVYASFGHMQVMTDPMHPLARSTWRLLFPFGRARGVVAEMPHLPEAASRLFLDLTSLLHHPLTRRMVGVVLPRMESLVASGVQDLLQRPELVRRPEAAASTAMLRRFVLPAALGVATALFWHDPDRLRQRIPEQLEALLAEYAAAVQAAPAGVERLQAAQRWLVGAFDRLIHIIPPILSSVAAGGVLEWLLRGRAEPGDLADVGRGLEGNVTTTMDLEVGDLADLARPHPAVCAALDAGITEPDAFAQLDGGAPFAEALRAFRQRYGMRGSAEIDLGRTMWRDDLTPVLQVVLGGLSRAPGAHREHHAVQAKRGEQAGRALVAAASPLTRWLVRRLVRVHRTLMALREHPKYLLVRLFDQTRAVALEAGEELVCRGQLDEPRDVFFLSFGELEAALGDERPLVALVAERKAALARDARRKPPRLMTSEGEVPQLSHAHADLPAGAMAGTAASAGVIEGVARVITDPAAQRLEHGEILVAPFTDPGWTTLFINAAGLVMEVGGMMTHGSVIAREYGIPAVVCVPEALSRIRTGDRVRVDGDRGIVELLDGGEA